MKKYTIYYHKSQDEKYYIGQTCQEVKDRWKNGHGYNSQKFNMDIIESYGGWENFEHGILETDVNESEVDEKEAYYIALYDAIDNGFNTYKENYSRYHFSDLWRNEETRKAIIAKLVALRNTAEYHESQSNMMKNLWQTEEYRESQKKAWTEERKNQRSRQTKECWKDEEYRNKIAQAQSGYMKKKWDNPEFRKKICKPVRCLETGEIFETIKAAAEWCGVKPNTLCTALSSKTHQSGKHPESGIKLHWERYSDEVGEEG